MAFEISYHTVFELSIWHHHFLDPMTGPIFTPPPTTGNPEQERLLLDYDVRNFLRVQPTPESMELIRRRGLVYKNTNRGCLLAAKDTYTTETNPGVKVGLVLSVTAPRFFDYTDFGLAFTAVGEEIFYLKNFGMAPPTPPDRILLSESGGDPHLRAADRKTWRPRIVRIARVAPGATTAVQVFDQNTASPGPALALELETDPNQPEFGLDCRSLREGLYRFESPNIDNAEFFLGLEKQGRIFGVVEIFLEGLNEAQYDIRLAKN